MRLHTGDRPFKCPQCSETFRTSGHLKTHILAHKASKSLKKWTAEVNEYFSSNLEVIPEGLNIVTEKDSVVSQEENLASSLGTLPDEAVADLLGGDLITSADFSEALAAPKTPPPNKRGRKKRTTAPVVHRCVTCDRTFSKPSLLERHKRVHTGERPFVCHLCPQRFNQRTVLNEHVKAHQGEKKFTCPYCPFSSVQKTNLRTHIGRLHQFAYYSEKKEKKPKEKLQLEDLGVDAIEDCLDADRNLNLDLGEDRTTDLEQVMGLFL